MVKSDLINALKFQTPDITEADVKVSVELILNKISDVVAVGGRVEIRHFGTFTKVDKAARIGRNPRTGEPVQVPAKAAVKFKSGGGMNFRINLEAETKLAA